MSKNKCEWEWKKLGDVSKIYNGNSINEKVKKERYSDIDEGYPFIATKDVSFNGDVDYDNGIRIPYSEDNFKTANSDTVLICAEGGSAGRKKCILNQRACFGNKLFAIDSNKEILKGKFVFYYVHHEFFLNEFKKLMAGIIGGVSSAKFKEILIPVPPLTEQERIVKVLDDAFAKIDKIKTDAETNLQNAKDLFQTTLANELSITDDKVKQGWQLVRLVDFALLKAGKFMPAKNIHSEHKSGYYPCFGGNGFRGYVDQYNQQEDRILIGRQGALCGNINIAKGKFYATEHAVVVSPYDESPLKFQYYLLNVLKLNQYATGAAQPGLSVEILNEKVSFFLPPLSIQKQIVAKLDSLSEKVKQLESNYKQVIADCDELKKSILKKAFEGNL